MKTEADFNYLATMTNHRLLTAEEEVSLCTTYQETGDLLARKKLIEYNIRLVLDIAKNYRTTMPLPDRVQHGILGLINAIEKFDHRKGFRFSTYATHWIRQAIGRAQEKEPTLRLPTHMEALVKKYLSLFPGEVTLITPESVAEKLMVGTRSAAKIIEAERNWRKPVSLDLPIGTNGGVVKLGDFIPDTSIVDTTDKTTIQNAVESLPQDVRDAIVLVHYRELSIEKAAKTLDVSINAFRKLLSKGYKQLRDNLTNMGVC